MNEQGIGGEHEKETEQETRNEVHMTQHHQWWHNSILTSIWHYILPGAHVLSVMDIGLEFQHIRLTNAVCHH